MARLKHYHEKGRIEAGCDEAGRGCLAGPVVAAAVILPEHLRLPGLDDSKKLSAAKRDGLRVIIEKQAIAWAVGIVGPRKIDEMNILRASFHAMHQAINALDQRPDSLLIDGHLFTPYPDIPHHCFVKGDARYRSIAAASILAKCHRDALMADLHDQHPQYDWLSNKGYPTADHRLALKQHGACEQHRRSFALGIEQLEIDL